MTMPRPPKPDHEIQSEVLAQLNRDGRLTPAEVGVEVCGGIVTLTGTVSSDEKAEAAANIAISVNDVHDVANKLGVEAGGREHDDTRVARMIRHAFGWNTAIPAERIDTIVRCGVVTMRGSVDHSYQREAAEATAAAVPGVMSVKDQIQLLAASARNDSLKEERTR